MDVRFLPPRLERLDEVTLDALALPIFEDERPLRGLAGEVDWRLCGLLSRWILRGRVTGAVGERVLLPPGRRLAVEKLFLFGLGPRGAFGTADGLDAERAVDDVLETLATARAGSAAVALPPEAGEPARAMGWILAAAARHPEQDDLVVLVDAAAQRAMAPVVEGERRRARAEGG